MTIDNTVDSSLILSIETSGRLGSVAIADGEKLLDEKHFTGPMRHSAEIFPSIAGLLGQFDKKPADIEEVYISAGPGSFTGLRIAVTIAKSMALANRTKIVTVDTLDCIAENVNPRDDLRPDEKLATILDAKRGQFFISVYEKNEGEFWNKVLPDCLMTANEFKDHFAEKPIALTGEGLVYYGDNFNSRNIRILEEKFWNPSAANVYRLGRKLAGAGQFADPITLTPNYIRGPDVKVKEI